MSALDDLRLDEMRDEEARPLFVRIPSQAWHKPVSVSLRNTGDVHPALAPAPDWPGLLHAVLNRVVSGEKPQEVGSLADNGVQDRGTALEFVIERPTWRPQSGAQIKPKPTTFEDFLRLADASDEEIRQFASKYGPLFIFSSKPEFEEDYKARASWPSAASEIEESLTRNDNLVIIEQCDVWRYFAGCMLALLHIMHAHSEKRKPQASDWEVIGNAPEAVTSTRHDAIDLLHPNLYGGEALWAEVVHFVRQGSDRDRKMCRELMNCLLELGRVRPWVTWEPGDQPELLFSGPSLLSYLALQLCLLALKHDSTAICSYCSRQYVVKRAIKAGQQNYCQACRKARVPARLSQRRKLAELRDGSKPLLRARLA